MSESTFEFAQAQAFILKGVFQQSKVGWTWKVDNLDSLAAKHALSRVRKLPRSHKRIKLRDIFTIFNFLKIRYYNLTKNYEGKLFLSFFETACTSQSFTTRPGTCWFSLHLKLMTGSKGKMTAIILNLLWKKMQWNLKCLKWVFKYFLVPLYALHFL